MSIQDILAALTKFDDADLAVIFFAFWGVSEALSLIPSVKSNGVFQLIANLLKSIGTRFGWLTCLVMGLLMTGCVTVTATIQQQSDDAKMTVKADTDMTPTTQTKASLGVGVGQAPNVTGGTVK